MQRSATMQSVVLGLSVLGLVGCTGSPSTPVSTRTQVRTVTQEPAAIATTPVAAGPTTTAVQDCPLVGQSTAMSLIGQRLDHATVQTSGGRTVGCEFLPITSGLAASEKLPKHGFPSARITVTTYPSAKSARQVLALVSRAGGSPSLQTVAGLVGETFQTRFYAPDGRSDWACAFITGPKLVTVLLADSTSAGQGSVLGLARAVAERL